MPTPTKKGDAHTKKRNRDLFEIVIPADQSEQHAEHWQRQ